MRSVTRYRPGKLSRNSLIGTVGLGARGLIQAAYLLLVSTWLGSEGYGWFAGSVAFVVLGSPLASWGMGLLLTRYVAQGRASSRAMWATALVQTGFIGSLLMLTAVVIGASVLRHHLALWPMLMLVASELLFFPVAQVATHHCLALERGIASSITLCLVPACRTLAVIGLMICGASAVPESAVHAHLMGSIAGCIGSVVVVRVVDGWPAWRGRMSIVDATRGGAPYAFSNFAGISYQEIDKVLLLQLLGATVVGPYTVAFRVVTILLVPVSALINATLPRLILLETTDSKSQTYRVVVLSAVVYGFGAMLAVLLLAPFMPRIFGQDYSQATQYAALLAPWPLLFSIRQCLGAKLIASNRHSARLVIELFGLILISVVNLYFLPRVGGVGAAYALLLTESAMVLAFAGVMGRDRSCTDPPRSVA